MLKQNAKGNRSQKEQKVRQRMVFGKAVITHKIPPFKKEKAPKRGLLAHKNTRQTTPRVFRFGLKGCIPARDALVQTPSRC